MVLENNEKKNGKIDSKLTNNSLLFFFNFFLGTL